MKITTVTEEKRAATANHCATELAKIDSRPPFGPDGKKHDEQERAYLRRIMRNNETIVAWAEIAVNKFGGKGITQVRTIELHKQSGHFYIREGRKSHGVLLHINNEKSAIQHLRKFARELECNK